MQNKNNWQGQIYDTFQLSACCYILYRSKAVKTGGTYTICILRIKFFWMIKLVNPLIWSYVKQFSGKLDIRFNLFINEILWDNNVNIIKIHIEEFKVVVLVWMTILN